MEHEQQNPGESSKSAVERFVKRPMVWAWNQIKFPVAVFLTMWIMGFGFYHGVMAAVDFGEMSLGRAIIISVIDLPTDNGDVAE